MATPLGNLQAASWQRFNANLPHLGGGGPSSYGSPERLPVPGYGYGGMGGGATSPEQLAALSTSNPGEGEQLVNYARGLAFNELERAPNLYQGQFAQNLGGAIGRQISGQDAPFTPQVQDQMYGQQSDMAAAAEAARQRQIGGSMSGRGLSGGGMESSLRANSMNQAAQQRASAQRQIGITSQLENYGARERAQSMGAGFLDQYSGALAGAGAAKAGMLGRYGITGQSGSGDGGGSGGGGYTGVPEGFRNVGFDGEGGSVSYGGGIGPQLQDNAQRHGYQIDPKTGREVYGEDQGLQYGQQHQAKVSAQREAEEQARRAAAAGQPQTDYARQAQQVRQGRAWNREDPSGYLHSAPGDPGYMPPEQTQASSWDYVNRANAGMGWA